MEISMGKCQVCGGLFQLEEIVSRHSSESASDPDSDKLCVGSKREREAEEIDVRRIRSNLVNQGKFLEQLAMAHKKIGDLRWEIMQRESGQWGGLGLTDPQFDKILSALFWIEMVVLPPRKFEI